MKTESTQELEQRRNAIIFALENSQDALDEEAYGLAITGIDRELNNRIWKRNVAIGLIVGAVVLGAVFALSGCGTIEGMRRDVHSLTAPSRISEDNR